jgi:hypothetical protein
VDASMRFGVPPDGYAGLCLQRHHGGGARGWLAKSGAAGGGRELRANPTYDHYKGKQFWRACDNKSFRDMDPQGRAPPRSRATGATSTSSPRSPRMSATSARAPKRDTCRRAPDPCPIFR